MATKKHIGKYTDICTCLIPRWEVLQVNIKWDKERLAKQEALPRECRDEELEHYLRKEIHNKSEELKRYNHLFN